MAYEPINLGDGISREPLGSALKKIDTMLSELYTTIPEGDFSAVSQNIVPDSDLLYNLGSETNRWHSLYVGSGSVYIGDAKLSATTNGEIILPGVYDPTGHEAVEVYPESGVGQERTWASPSSAFLIDAFTWAALGGTPGILIPEEWVRAEYLATLNEEGYISGATVVVGGNEYSDTVINGVNDVATISTDYMYVYTGLSGNPLSPFVSGDWTQIPFAVRSQATGTNLSSTIGQSVSYDDLVNKPDQALNTTDSVEFADLTADSVTTPLISTTDLLEFTVGSSTVSLDYQGVMTFPQVIQFTTTSPAWPATVGWAQGLEQMLVSSYTDVVIQADDNGDDNTPVWTFGTDSTLTLPAGGTIEFDNGSLAVDGYTRVADAPFNINVADTAGKINLNWGVSHSAYTNKVTLDAVGVTLTTNTSKEFVFGTDGSVDLPTNSYLKSIKTDLSEARMGWHEFLAGPTIGWGMYAQHDIYIQTDNDITKPTWVFKENGSTQFPGFTFPATDGTVGQVLATNGSGTLAWTTISGGSGTDISTASINDLADVNVSSPTAGQVLKWNGTAWINDTDANDGGVGGGTLSTRTTRAVTTSSLANGASANATITGFSGYALLSVETSAAAWVTVYTSSAARTADASRLITDDPIPGSGVVAEVITTGAQTQAFTPGVFGYNDEGTPTTDIFIKVVNRSGSSAAITVTLKLLQLEA